MIWDFDQLLLLLDDFNVSFLFNGVCFLRDQTQNDTQEFENAVPFNFFMKPVMSKLDS